MSSPQTPPPRGDRTFVSGGGSLAFFDLPWIALYIVICFAFHWLIGTAALIGAVILFSIALLTEFASRAPSKRATTAASERLVQAEGVRRNAEVVRALGMKRRMIDHWVRALLL
jgi:ABC-type protease/lipase transport system fused ATPase/permease subunit